MLAIILCLTITPGELTGFWHSEPSLSHGYQSCYFLWDTGEYAYLESIDKGVVELGSWYLAEDALAFLTDEAIRLNGAPVKIKSMRTALRLVPAGGEENCIILGGESYYRLGEDPLQEFISLVPTWGMSADESEAFSTYD